MNVKVLPLPYWAHRDIDSPALLGVVDRYRELNPVFNRDGMYLEGNECWLEIDGRAFVYDAEQFKFELALLDAGEYNNTVYKALIDICRVNLATKEQRKLLYMIEVAKDVRNTSRSIKKHMRRMFK